MPVPTDLLWPANNWPTDKVSLVADLCSVLGVFLTGYLTITAKKLKQQLQYRERLVRYQTKVLAHRTRLVLYADTFDQSSKAIDTEIAQIEGNIISFKRELSMLVDDTVNTVNVAIKQYQARKTPENFHILCDRLHTLTIVIENRVQGLLWEI